MFSALSIDLRVGISQSASEIDDCLFFLPIIGKIKALKNTVTITLYDGQLRTIFSVFHYGT